MRFPRLSDEQVLRQADEEDAGGCVTACNPRFLRPPFASSPASDLAALSDGNRRTECVQEREPGVLQRAG
jgi:hypothetical protein